MPTLQWDPHQWEYSHIHPHMRGEATDPFGCWYIKCGQRKELLGDVYVYVASGSALKLDPDGLWSDFWFFGAKLSLGLMPCKRGREECHCSAGRFFPYIIDWLYIICVIVKILLLMPWRLSLSISEYCRRSRCLSFFNGRLFIYRRSA